MRILMIITTFLIWTIGAKAAELVLPSENGDAVKEVSIESEGYQLFGTLQDPEVKKNLSIVLLIAGSGPTDRDGNQPNLVNNSFKMLANELAIHDIATLRYDKRGIAKSTVPGFSNADVIFENYVSDAVNWIKYIQGLNRYEKVYVAGLSEGSLIGMLAAHRAGADGFISLNGPGRPADEIIMNQLKANATPQNILDEVTVLVAKIKEGERVVEVPPYLLALFHSDLQPYMKSWFSYNPGNEIGNLEVPVLIIQGENDIQVAVEDANLLSEGCPKAKISIIEGMNHILKDADSNPQLNFATYNNPDLPLNTKLVKELVTFIQQ